MHTRRAKKVINTFTINNVEFKIILSCHAQDRLLERKIDLFQTIGIVLSLGEARINQYNNSGKEVFIMDVEHNFSIVLEIRNNEIHIITVINKSDCYIKQGTIAVNL